MSLVFGRGSLDALGDPWGVRGGPGELSWAIQKFQISSVGQSRSSNFPQLGDPEVPNEVATSASYVLGLPGCSLGASKNIEKTLVFIVFPA